MDKRLIGVIISGVWSVAILIAMITGVTYSDTVAIMELVISVLVVLVSFFLVGFGPCLKMLWRIMSSGIRVPVMPLNLILFLITFAVGLAFGLQFPIIVTLPTYLKGQPTETESV